MKKGPATAKSKLKFNESFSLQDMAGIRVGIRELARVQLEYRHPIFLQDDLISIWNPDYTAPDYSLGSSKWLVGMTKQFKKDVQNIDRKLQGRILQSITEILDEPITPKGDTIKPLTSDLKGYWRVRVGDFRLIYLLKSCTF